MPGLYDRLRSQLDDDDDKSAGLTPLDIAGLPEDQRRVMFALLRDADASSDGITEDALQDKLSDLEGLPDVLAELIKQSWLIELGEPPNVRYKVNLRHKRGSKFATNLWASLSDRLTEDEE
jgi:hypothetical protein